MQRKHTTARSQDILINSTPTARLQNFKDSKCPNDEVDSNIITEKKELSSVDALLSPAWELNDRGDNGRSSGETELGGSRDELMTSYGLSIHRIDMRAWGFDDGPTRLLGHLGRAYGVLSLALYDPDSQDGIAMIITGVANDPF